MKLASLCVCVFVISCHTTVASLTERISHRHLQNCFELCICDKDDDNVYGGNSDYVNFDDDITDDY